MFLSNRPDSSLCLFIDCVACHEVHFWNPADLVSPKEISVYSLLYNNKINARVLIGQSAMVYCAGIARLLNYYIKAIYYKFLSWFVG